MVDLPPTGACENAGCTGTFRPYRHSRLKRTIGLEEYVATRRAENKPVLCNQCLADEFAREL